MLDFIAMPFGYLMKFCCWIAPNYLIALALFTLIIQVALCLLFGIKQQKNSIKQARLAPKVAALRKKYAGRTDQVTLQKQQQEIMDLYQEHGTSQFGGCLPMLIQMPIILALYQVIRYPLRFICGVGMNSKEAILNVVKTFAEKEEAIRATLPANVEFDKLTTAHTSNAEYAIIKHLANGGADHTGELSDIILPQFEMGPLDMSQIPTVGINLLILIPILIFVTTLASQFITRKFMYQDPAVKEQQNSGTMKIMTYTMPLLSVWIAFGVPAAVGIYWIYRSVFATLQQIILTLCMPFPKYTEEDFKAAEREMNSTKRTKKKSTVQSLQNGEKKRSLHHIDDDDEDVAPAPKKKEKLIEVEVRPEDAPVMKEDKGVKYEKK
jgi:YidC/Oxa1 family membrane protein insertase